MDHGKPSLYEAFFFCQRLDPDQDVNRRKLERLFGERIKLFPLPCSGRIEPIHLLRSLESGIDRVWVVTCPEGACRYHQGNLRAKKRVEFARGLIQEIGLEAERFQLVITTNKTEEPIDRLLLDILENSDSDLKPSPLSSNGPCSV